MVTGLLPADAVQLKFIQNIDKLDRIRFKLSLAAVASAGREARLTHRFWYITSLEAFGHLTSYKASL